MAILLKLLALHGPMRREEQAPTLSDTARDAVATAANDDDGCDDDDIDDDGELEHFYCYLRKC